MRLVFSVYLLLVYFAVASCSTRDESGLKNIFVKEDFETSVYVGRLGFISEDVYFVRGSDLEIVSADRDEVIFNRKVSGKVIEILSDERVVKFRDEVDDNGVYVYVDKNFVYILDSIENRKFKYRRDTSVQLKPVEHQLVMIIDF